MSGANIAMNMFKMVFNVGGTNSQESSPLNQVGFGLSTSPLVTMTVDTTIDQYISVRGQLANAGDTMTLEDYYVAAIPWSH